MKTSATRVAVVLLMLLSMALGWSKGFDKGWDKGYVRGVLQFDNQLEIHRVQTEVLYDK